MGDREDDIDVDSRSGKHAHQGVDAEKINPSANEIADPRLRDTELGDNGTRMTVGLDRFARSFCNTTAGRVLPTSDPTTGSNWTR